MVSLDTVDIGLELVLICHWIPLLLLLSMSDSAWHGLAYSNASLRYCMQYDIYYYQELMSSALRGSCAPATIHPLFNYSMFALS